MDISIKNKPKLWSIPLDKIIRKKTYVVRRRASRFIGMHHLQLIGTF